MKKKAKRVDIVMLVYFVILLIFGLVMLTSASSAIGHERFGDVHFFIKRQLLFGLLPGTILFVFFTFIKYEWLKRLSPYIFTVGLILLILVFIPGIGSTYGTASHSWLTIFGFSFQPAEFAKIGLIVFLSWFLAREGKPTDLKGIFLPVLVLGLTPIILVVLQPDIGTVSILFAILFAILFVAEAKWSHLGLLFGLGVASLVLMVMIAPYRAARLTTFLHPELDPLGVGYHINQATLAVGSGGVFGLGYGRSRQKFQYLPEVHADSIYAVIAEELGFFFAVALIILFILILLRGLRIAKYAPDNFGRLVVSGVVIWFVVQAFLNIGAMIGILPLTGVPLPFISHGGSALMVSLGAVGMVLNVSRHTVAKRHKFNR